MNIKKKIAITGLLAFAIASFATASMTVSAQKYELVSDLFETQFVSVESETIAQGNPSTGVALTANRSGAFAKFTKTFSGPFSLDYSFYADSAQGYGIRDFKIVFYSKEAEEEFFVSVKENNGKTNYSVGIGEDVYSVNGYGESVQISNKENQLVFDPTTYTVSVDGTKLWSFATFRNGIYENDVIFDAFNTYEVALEFLDAKSDGHIILYALNGQRLETEVLYKNEAPPVLYAPVKYNGIVGEMYFIPQPYAYDVIDGAIDCSEIHYTLQKDVEVLLQGNYQVGDSFVPTAAGDYVITYTVQDSGGLKNTIRQTFSVLEEKPVCEFKEYGALEPLTIGKGGKVYIPRVTAKCALSNNRDTYVYATILLNGSVIDEVKDKAANGFDYTFIEAGEYQVVYGVSCGKIQYETSYTITVEDNVPYLTMAEQLPEFITVGQRYRLPEATMTFRGETFETEKSVYFPSGAKYRGNDITFKEYGFYQIEYTAKIGEITYSESRWVKSVTPSDSVFQGNVSIETGEYHRAGEVYKGAVITQTVGKGGVRFAYPIDISNNTKDDTIIDLIAYPFVAGVRDYRTFIIRLTDTEDKNNEIVIDISQVSSWEEASQCYAKISHSNLEFKGVEKPGKVHDGSSNYGYYIAHPFQGFENTTLECSIRVSMDYETKRIYFYDRKGTHLGLGDGAATDLDSLALYSKEWKGFTNGKCYVSVEASNFYGNEARYVIKSVGDYNLEDDFLNYSAPEINVDLENNDQLPKGIVKQKYPLFSATAKNLFGESVKVSSAVYYNYGTDKEIEVDTANGSFTPFIAGEYTIVYSAKDGLNHISKKELTVQIETNPEEFISSFQENKQDAYSGEPIDLQFPIYTGNRGEVIVKSLSVKKKSDGKVCDIQQNAFIAQEKGVYVVEYVLSDWLNREAVANYEIHVQNNPTPVFEQKLNILPVYIVGQSYTLPKISALDYSGDEVKQTEIFVEVEYQDGYKIAVGEDLAFVPETGHGDEFTVFYLAEASVSSQKRVVSAKSTLVDFNSTSGNLNISDYFVKNNVQFTANKLFHSVEVVDNTQPASFMFGKSLLAEMFSLRMQINKESNMFSTLKITMMDAQDSSVQIVVRIMKNTETTSESILIVNDGDEEKMAGSFWGLDKELGSKNDLQLIYKNSTRQILDATQKPITGVSKDVYGNEFTGFPSGLINVKFEFEGVETEGKAAVDLYKFNNQALSAVNNDTTKPEFIINGDYGGVISVGTEITLPTAFGSDVLGFIKSITVTVTDANNLPIKSMDGTLLSKADAMVTHRIKFTGYGKHKVVYTIKDSNGQTATSSAKIYYVMPTEKPTFNLDSEIATKGKVGETVNLPTAILDNEECHYNVLVIDPNFTHTVVFSSKKMNAETEKSFTWQMKGKHVVRYYVYDEYNNYTIEDYIVYVD